MDAIGSARLAERIPADRAVATTVSRDDILEALGDEGPAELLLDVRHDSGETDRIGISWSRDELARLLDASAEEQVRLTFDAGELAAAFADVEAHGLRERAALITVAAAGLAGAGVAAAMPLGPGEGPVAPAAGTMLTDVSSGGGYEAPAPAAATDAMVTDASSGGGYAAPEPTAADRVTDVSTGGYPPAPAAPADAGGSGIDVAAPAAGGAAGALALTIAAAAFVARRRRDQPRPA